MAAKKTGLTAQLARADQAVMATLPGWRNSVGITVARAVTSMAEPGFAGGVLAAVAVAAMRDKGLRMVAIPVVLVPAGMLARKALSDLIARSRPPQSLWLAKPEGYSLPSRHTTLAALTAGACATSAGVSPLSRHASVLLAAACVGASRVYLGVHWPTDVLAAWLFAEAWLWIAEQVAGIHRRVD